MSISGGTDVPRKGGHSLCCASARVEVTPPAELLAAGAICTGGFWYERALPMRRVRDPLYARIALFADEHREVALLSWESLGDGVGLRARILAQLAAAGAPALAVILTCTHSHTVPDTIQLSGVPVPDSYLDGMARAIAQAIVTARDRLRPVAALHVASVPAADLILNRRPILRDGRLAVLESTPDPATIAEAGVVDDAFTVVTLTDEAERPLARLLHWACHPVAMQAQPVVSPGFPGLLARRFEADDGDGSATLFLNGACGDINPRAMGRWEFAESLAVELHRRALAAVPVQRHELPFLAHAAATLSARRRTDAAAADALVEPVAAAPEGASAEARHSGDGWRAFLAQQSRRVAALPDALDLDVGALRIGPVILATAGGEIFAESGVALRARAPALTVLPVSYANAYCGYLAPRRAYALGGYEVECAPWCPLAAGETERVVDALGGLVAAVVHADTAEGEGAADAHNRPL